MALELIDRPDTFELVRDKVAALLVAEVANQQALATAAGKDPTAWKLRVFTERSNAWEQFADGPPQDRSPIVNVWFDRSTFDPRASNTVERQKAEAYFNVDCIGYGVAQDNAGGGHKAGDQEAALEAHKALRLVRSILMAAEHTYLGLRGVVWQRWPDSVTTFQPRGLDDRPAQQIVGARLALRVTFNEMSPQTAAQTLEQIGLTVYRAEDGEVVLRADYDTTGSA